MGKTDNWNANLYDQSHAFVSSYGKGVLELLNPQKGEYILDLGCGTGDIANEIHELGADVIGMDRSENMIEQAKSKYDHLHFKVGDVLQLNETDEFDAIFSNAVLHWVKSPSKALENMYRSLKQGGRLVAEFGGKDNIASITTELRKQFAEANIEMTEERYPWYYPSIGEYTTLMEEAGFRVTFAAHLDRQTPLLGEDGLRNWLDMFTGTMFTGITESVKTSILSNVEKNLKDTLFHNGEWVVDYKRIRVIGVKE